MNGVMMESVDERQEGKSPSKRTAEVVVMMVQSGRPCEKETVQGMLRRRHTRAMMDRRRSRKLAPVTIGSQLCGMGYLWAVHMEM